MRFVLAFLVLGSLFTGCRNKEMSPEHLSRISVIREAEATCADNQTAHSAPKSVVQPPVRTNIQPVPQQPHSQSQYHIIVASFSATEKARAEKMVAKLRAKNYPATLLYSSQRYRISIESFSSETEANAARDEYRSITDRQDIWVHKVN